MQELDFICEIQRDPLNDEPRLVFADWLEEQGDVRGEFIRVQCNMLRVPESERGQFERRVQELLLENSDPWQETLQKLGGSEITFRRGFVHRLKINASKFSNNVAEIFRISPLLFSLRIETPECVEDEERTVDEQLAALWNVFFGMPQLSRIGELSFRYAHPIEAVMPLIAANQNLKRIRTLGLSRCNVDDESVETLIGSNVLRLRRLYLAANYITDGGAMRIVESPLFARLQLLDLRFNDHITQETKEELQQRFRQKIWIDSE